MTPTPSSSNSRSPGSEGSLCPPLRLLAVAAPAGDQRRPERLRLTSGSRRPGNPLLTLFGLEPAILPTWPLSRGPGPPSSASSATPASRTTSGCTSGPTATTTWYSTSGSGRGPPRVAGPVRPGQVPTGDARGRRRRGNCRLRPRATPAAGPADGRLHRRLEIPSRRRAGP